MAGQAEDFYKAALAVLNEAGCRYLLGGGYAYAIYTGVGRQHKDLDIFVKKVDLPNTLGTLAAAGYRTELTFPHWLGKAHDNGSFIDVIHNSGNGVAVVDDEWFEHSVPATALDVAVRLCPVEEMIWSKAFVMERERYDGADVLHLISSCGSSLDWERLIRRFKTHWQVLLSHLVLFDYVYPGERDKIPDTVRKEMVRRLRQSPPPEVRVNSVCRGTLLSRAQFQVDVEYWGYRDVRMDSDIGMDSDHIRRWTAAVGEEVRTYEAQEQDALSRSR